MMQGLWWDVKGLLAYSACVSVFQWSGGSQVSNIHPYSAVELFIISEPGGGGFELN